MVAPTITIALLGGIESLLCARIADKLTDVVTSLRLTSRTLKAAAGEILSGANDLSERTTKQAATIEETSAAIEQLASTVLQNADRARDANADAQVVSRTADGLAWSTSPSTAIQSSSRV